MDDKLKSKDIKSTFGERPFTSDELYQFYQKYDPNLKRSTFRWRVYALRNDGVISDLKRGVYTTKSKRNFEPAVSNKLASMFLKVKNKFPYINMCIWETSWLNNLMVHQIFSNNIILEVDRDATKAVFAFIQESHKDTYFNPGKHEVNNYILASQNNIIIKNLTVTSPLQEIQNVTIPTIEKIMVDLFTDDELFVAYQGAELQNIYQELFGFYNINRSRLKQYAHKRHVRDKFITFLKAETNIDKYELFM